MQQEFSRPERLVIAGIAMRIWPDVGVEQEGLAIFDDAVGVLEVRLAFANGFDLGAAQGNACLEAVEQEVIVPGCPIDSGITLSRGHGIARLVLLRSLNVGMCDLAGHTWGSEAQC